MFCPICRRRLRMPPVRAAFLFWMAVRPACWNMPNRAGQLFPVSSAVCSCRLQRTIRFAVAVACFIRKKELPSAGKTPFVNGSSAEWLQVILAHGLQKPSSPAYISSGLRSVSVRVRDAGWGCYGYKKEFSSKGKLFFIGFVDRFSSLGMTPLLLGSFLCRSPSRLVAGLVTGPAGFTRRRQRLPRT